MKVLGIIAARRGSKGVPSKNTMTLIDKAVIEYTIKDALAAKRIDKIVVTSDDPKVKQICENYRDKLIYIDRPAELASDEARIDDVMRHACRELESQENYIPDYVVLLYANVPVRAEGVIDQAINHLIEKGGDSLQTLETSRKYHPYWQYEMREGNDKIKKFINEPQARVYLRQALPPAYIIDGAVGVVRYEVLFNSADNQDDPHAFWGKDRRGLKQEPGSTIDIDEAVDLLVAENVIRNNRILSQQNRSRE